MKRALATSLIVLAAIVLAIAVAGWWVIATPGGARFVLERAALMMGKGTRVEGVEGRLGGKLRVKLVLIDRPDLFVRVDDVDMDTSLGLTGGLTVHRLHARKVEVRTASTGAAASLPASLKPPRDVTLEDGGVGELTFGALGTHDKDVVLHDIVLRGAGDKQRWRIDQAAVVTQYGKASVAGTLGNAPPFEVSLDARFEGRIEDHPATLSAKLGGTLRALEAKAEGVLAGARASAQASIEPLAKPPVKSLAIDASDVDLRQLAGALPATRLSVQARLVPHGGNAVEGTVRVANAEPGPLDRARLPFVSAAAAISASADGADLTQLEVALSGGGSARGAVHVKPGNVHADLQVSGVDLAALHASLQPTQVAGKIAVSGDRSAQRFDVSLEDPRFAVEGRATLAGKRLDVASAEVRTGGGVVTAAGSAAFDGRKAFRFEGRAQHFDPSAFARVQHGDLNFTFTVAGSAAEPVAGEARLDIAASRFQGMPASGRIGIAGDKQRIARADVDVALGEARMTAKGSFGARGDAMDVMLHAPDLSVIAAPFGIALAGKMDATAKLTGTFQSPAGSVSLDAANLGLPSNVYVREMKLRAAAGSLPDSPVDATLAARGIAVGKETPPTPVAESLDATVKGTRLSHRLDAKAVMSSDTTVRAAFQGGTPPRSPQLAWSGTVESFAVTGRAAFALASPAKLDLSAARIELGDATLRGDWGETRLQTTRWTPATLDLKGSSSGIRIENLAKSLRLGTLPASDLIVAGDWDVHGAQAFDARLDVKRVSGDVRVGDPPKPLGLTDLVVHADVSRGNAHAQLHVAGTRIGSVSGEGNARIVRGAAGWEIEKTAPVAAHVTASIPDLQTLSPWVGPDARLGGRLDANITVSGTGADPGFSGTARAQSLVLREPQSGFEISQGEVSLRLAGQTVTIERLVARTPWRAPKPALDHMRRVDVPEGGGTLSAEGSLDFESHRGTIRLKADKVPVTQLATRFVAVSGDAQLDADAKGILAVGHFGVDGGWVGALAEAPPTPADDVVVVRASQPAAPPEHKEPMRVDLTVALNERLWFEGRGLDTRLAGDLRVTGEVGSTLRATGSIRAMGGTYEGYGQKLSIERGVLTFAGPVDNPKLNVLALRKGLPVEAGVEITGTTARPRVRLVSTPDVPEPEKLSWLVLGRGASDASPGDMSVLAAAAGALLGGNNPGSDISKKIGIDEVKIGRPDTVLGVLPAST
ncbi:MAG TPA: translocation/assembly module TamB domain-containing protein, partial [Usitatibacter sp.]|nr:translocation/assembly module TamB domain-containing protein [Usitatibacter sp.]